MAWQFLKGLMGQNAPDRPTRGEWDAIVQKIRSDLKASRVEWLGACANLLQREFQVPFTPQLTGEADLVTSVYHFVLAAALIGSQKYIAPEDGRDFCTLLWAEIGEGRNPERRNEVYQTFLRRRATDDGGDISFLVLTVAKAIRGASRLRIGRRLCRCDRSGIGRLVCLCALP